MTKESQKQTEFAKVAECLYRNKSSSTYYALVKRNGRQIRKSLKTKDRKLADRRLKDFRQSIEKLSGSKNLKQTTFQELTELWFPTATSDLKPSSKSRIELCLKFLNKNFGHSFINGITPRDCQNWSNRRGKSISASTYNKEFETLNRLFEYAIQEGIILDNPSKVIKRRKVTDKAILIPSRKEFQILIETLFKSDSRYAEALTLVKLLALSGMRLTEATSIKWGEIDFEKGIFVVTGGTAGTKNRLVRHVPLFPGLKNLLNELKQDQRFERDQKIISIKSAKNAIKTSCRVAEIPTFSHHCLRHYFVSNAIEKGIDFKTIANWIGHKDGGLLVAKTYGHLRDTHSMEMAKLMD